MTKCDKKKECFNWIQSAWDFVGNKFSPLANKMWFMALIIIALLNLDYGVGFTAVNIQLNVKETLGISRNNEMVHNGIPVSRDENLKDTTNLIIEDSMGNQVPATFEALSRWAGGKNDTSKEIQWLLVSFPATVSANARNFYYLKTGTPVSRPTKIAVTDNTNDYTVDTGSAKFVISKNSLTLFDSISFAGNGAVILQNNGGSNSTIKGQPVASANAPDSVIVERMNDHYVCIKAEGDYANTPVGSPPGWTGASDHQKPLSYKVRYEFYAGSPTVVVYHKFYWSGQQGSIDYGDPISLDNISLLLPDVVGYVSTDVYADASTFYTGELSASQTASVNQKRRTLFADPHIAKVKHGTKSVTTTFASQPMLINRSDKAAVAVTIDHMQYFEPQSIVTDHTGKITVNVMSESQKFANYQGAWARIGISAMESGATYEDTVSENLAPLNNRLFAFPSSEYVRNSKVFLELPLTPSSSSSSELQLYYDKLKAVTETTKRWLEKERYHGLMTWGSLTRYASLNGHNETGSGTGWDKIYSGALNTDYHNTWKNVVFQFVLEGDASNLYDLSFMGARRMLHTQIIQPDAEHSITQMGWGYCGYQKYRQDANSSHSYFDNLYNYYYMTGDMEVVDILKVAVEKKAPEYTRDKEGQLNDQVTGGSSWAAYVGRMASQFASIFHFIGHVYDAKYLDDFKHMFDHAFSVSIVLLSNGDGKEYGFVSNETDVSSGFASGQFWMSSEYFMHSLYMLYNEWGDITLGSSNLKISRVYKAVINGFVEYAAKVHADGDGTWGGTWINRATINYSGNKIGGSITSVVPIAGSDPRIYVTGKANIVSATLRAGALANVSEFTEFGKQGLTWLVDQSTFLNSDSKPWGKENGLLYIRLHHGMSYLDQEAPPVVSDFPAPPNLRITRQGE